MRGFLVGALALVAIQRVLSHPQAYGRVGGIFRIAAEAGRRFMDPDVPAFGNPDPRPLDVDIATTWNPRTIPIPIPTKAS